MFNLFRSRQKMMRYLLGAILAVVCVSMVTYLIPGYGQSSTSAANDDVIATIGSEKITTQDVTQRVQALMRGQQIPAAMMQTYLPQMVDRHDPAAGAEL